MHVGLFRVQDLGLEGFQVLRVGSSCLGLCSDLSSFVYGLVLDRLNKFQSEAFTTCDP